MEFKDDINKKLEHKSIPERDENEILCERVVLLKKENNCLKKRNLKSIVYNSNSHINKNRKTQWKSLKSIYQDHLDKPETPTPINLTNRFESLHVTEENSAPENKNNYATPKYTIPNDKPKSCHNL